MRLQLRVLEHHIDDTIRTGRSFSLEHEDLEDMRNSIIHVYMNRIGLTRGDKIEETFCKFFKLITLTTKNDLRVYLKDSILKDVRYYRENLPNEFVSRGYNLFNPETK